MSTSPCGVASPSSWPLRASWEPVSPLRRSGHWTTASTSFAQRPPDPATILARLRDEETRAASLTDQLAAVRSRADELAAALDAATAKSSADAATAADLARQLADAKVRLEHLTAPCRRDAARPASPSRHLPRRRRP